MSNHVSPLRTVFADTTISLENTDSGNRVLIRIGRSMSTASDNIFDWGRVYQDSLMTEILRSERRRVAILAELFTFAVCVYTFFSFVSGLLDTEFRSGSKVNGPGSSRSMRWWQPTNGRYARE